MVYLVIKFCMSAVLIVAISEIGKRHSFAAALLASLPLTSLLAFVWLYLDTKDPAKIIALSNDIAWLVIPSLTLFIVLPLALKYGLHFWVSLVISCLATALAYGLMKLALSHIR